MLYASRLIPVHSSHFHCMFSQSAGHSSLSDRNRIHSNYLHSDNNIRSVAHIHAAGKLAAIHLDLVDGLSADTHGVSWLARSGTDAIITSHGRLVPAIRREGCLAIHRLLLSRRSHLDSAMKAAARAAPDILEVLPGIVLPSITQLLPRLGIPVLAGGFIRSDADVRSVMAAGALGVTTSMAELWGSEE